MKIFYKKKNYLYNIMRSDSILSLIIQNNNEINNILVIINKLNFEINEISNKIDNLIKQIELKNFQK